MCMYIQTKSFTDVISKLNSHNNLIHIQNAQNNYTLVLVYIFLFIVRLFFVVCIRSSKSVVFKISLSSIFHAINVFLLFQQGFQLPYFNVG